VCLAGQWHWYLQYDAVADRVHSLCGGGLVIKRL
jgi:hypothetical protein